MTRGCGDRISGGVYLTVGLSKNGYPLEFFLLDPPLRIDPEMERQLQLSDVGIKIIERTDSAGDGIGVWDVWDIVGQKYYPNVADMIEETRYKGVSRRISTNEDFYKLTPESRLFLMHRRAWIENYQDYYGAMLVEQVPVAAEDGFDPELRCPKRMLAQRQITMVDPHTIDPGGHSQHLCLGTVYEDVEGERDFLTNPRGATGTVGDIRYEARERPSGILPHYALAIFARFPIHQIDVIRDKDRGTHVESHQKATKANLPVTLQDE